MRILKINPNKPERQLLRIAADVLKNGGLIIYPTDTLYGLGANALNRKSVKKVYKVKGRKFKKPLSVAFNSLKQAQKYVTFNASSIKLARRLLPGPLTIIVPMKRKFPKELTRQKIGIRIPDNRIVFELLKMTKFPITATSANISSKKDPVTAEDAANQIGNKVNLIIDGGRCKYSKPSTIVEIVDDYIRVIREGVLKKRLLKA